MNDWRRQLAVAICMVSGCAATESPISELIRQESLSSRIVDFAALPRSQMQEYLRQELEAWRELSDHIRQTGGVVTKYGTWSTIGKGPDADRALTSIANAAERRRIDESIRTSTTPDPPWNPPPPAVGPTTTMLYGATISTGARRVKMPPWQTQRIAGWTRDLAKLVARVASGESTQAEERDMVRRIREQWQTVAAWFSG